MRPFFHFLETLICLICFLVAELARGKCNQHLTMHATVGVWQTKLHAFSPSLRQIYRYSLSVKSPASSPVKFRLIVYMFKNGKPILSRVLCLSIFYDGDKISSTAVVTPWEGRMCRQNVVWSFRYPYLTPAPVCHVLGYYFYCVCLVKAWAFTSLSIQWYMHDQTEELQTECGRWLYTLSHGHKQAEKLCSK